MWLTPTKGSAHDQAYAFAALTPTSSEPTSPGPIVAATAEIFGAVPARFIASITTGPKELEVGPAGNFRHDTAES